MPECPVTLVSPHVLEELFMIDYTPMIGYTVHVSDDFQLQFIKLDANNMYVCDPSNYVK